MLLSIGKKKRSFNANGPSEDGITSAVFGPLRVLPPADGLLLLHTLLFRSQRFEIHPDEVHSVDFRFWPYSQGVIPDLVVDAKMKNCDLHRLVVEMKWESGLSGNEQLENQRKEFNTSEVDKFAHVYLIQHFGNDTRAALDKARQDEHLVELVTWHDICANALKYRRKNCWFEDIYDFLTALGVVPYTGFRQTPIPPQLKAAHQWKFAPARLCWKGFSSPELSHKATIESWSFKRAQHGQ